MGRGVRLLIVFLLVLSLFQLGYATVAGLDSVGDVSRIADLNSDGFLEALAYADRISTSEDTIRYYEHNGTTFSLYQTLTTKEYEFCSMDYQDSNQDGYQELFFSCQNTSGGVEGLYFTYNGSDFENTQNFTDVLSLPSGTSLSDTVFLDFTGDQRADIFSCFHVNNSNFTYLYIQNDSSTTNFTAYNTQINVDQFYDADDGDYDCNFVPLDYDGDGDFDLLTYTYDGDNVTLYENTQVATNMFINRTNSTWYNTSFFEGKRIKSIAAFDSNQDGFSDLVYVVDTGTTAGGRAIEFGQLLNQHRQDTQTRTITNPSLANIITRWNNDSFVNFSWENQSGGPDFVEFNITQANLQIGGTNQGKVPFTQVLFNATNYTFGEIFESSYDRNAPYGNVRYENTSINRSLPLIFFNITLQAISPSKQVKQNTTVYEYKPTYTHTNSSATAFGTSFEIELCNGLDDDGDGDIDEDFTITFPDNTTGTIDYNKDGGTIDGDKYAQSYTATSGSYSITLDCSRRFIELGEVADTNDNVKQISLSGGGSGDNTVSGGGGSSFAPPETTDTTDNAGGDDGVVGEDDSTDTTDTQTDTSTGGGGSSDPNQLYQFSTKEFEVFQTITYNDGRTFIQEEIKNIERTNKEKIKITKIIPKEVLLSASEITYVGLMKIIEDDPIVEFTLSELGYLESKTISYSLPGRISQFDLNLITTQFQSLNELTTEEIQAQIEENFQKAQESIKVNVSEVVRNNKTEFTIQLELQDEIAEVKNVEVEQYIPKCLIEEITDTILEAAIDPSLLDSVEIKEADPIIVWNLENIDRGQELKLALEAFREEDCDDEFKVTVLANSYIRENQEVDEEDLANSLYFTAAIIIFFGLLFFIATRDPHKHENPHVHRLVKIILHRFHRGESKDSIKSSLLAHEEQKADVDEAFKHLDEKGTNSFVYHLFKHGLEIIIFLTLLVLNVIDFVGVIPGYIDWLKKIISIILILFILYKVNITKILFNNESKSLNFLILASMLILHLKNLHQFARQGLEENIGFVYALYSWIWNHEVLFEFYLFIVGLVLLAIVSFSIAKWLEVREGCIYFLCTHHSKAKGMLQILIRTAKVFFILLLFFFVIFNRVVEWLAVSIDATVFVLATLLLFLLLFSTTIHTFGKKQTIFHSLMNTLSDNVIFYTLTVFLLFAFIKPFVHTFVINIIWYTILGIFGVFFLTIFISQFKQKFAGLEHLSTAVDSLYEKFLKLFHYPQTLLLGISGLFVLQNIVEIALYLIPNITGHTSHLYLAHGEQTLLSLIGESSLIATHLFTMTLSHKILYSMVYLFSLLGYFLIFFIPIYVWIIHFTNRHIHPSKLNLEKSLFKHHRWTQRIGKIIVTMGIPLIAIALFTKLLDIRPLIEETANGVLISASQITLSPFVSFVSLLVMALFMIFVAAELGNKKIHTVLIYVTFWLGLFVNIWMYIVPSLQALFFYLKALFVYALTATIGTKIVTIILLVFFTVDAILIIGVGILTLMFFMLTPRVKQGLMHALLRVKYLRRLFFLSNNMMFLDYFEDAKKHLSSNMIHHLTKYAKVELREGHHIETILLQFKLHHYPDEMIDQVVKDLIEQEGLLIEALPAQEIDPKKVASLLKKFRRRHFKKATYGELVEEFESDYTLPEIKLAYKYARNDLIKEVTSTQIEDDYLMRMKELHAKVSVLKVKKMHKDDIVLKLTSEGYDPELILRIADAKETKTVRMKHLVKLVDEIESISDLETRAMDLASAFEKYNSDEIEQALTIVERKAHTHIEHDEVHRLKALVLWIKEAKKRKMKSEQIILALSKEGWDKKLVQSVLDTDLDTHSQKELDTFIEHQYIYIKSKK